MKREAILVAAIVLPLFVAMPADGQTVTNSPTEFQNMIAGLGTPTIIDFDGIDASPCNNTIAGRTPFDGTAYGAQGISFSNPDGQDLFIAPGCLFWNESNSLSVYMFPYEPPINDDDLDVVLDPPAVAVGFTLVDNGTRRSDEYIQFLDSDGDVILQVGMPSNYSAYRAFVGVVSMDRAIASVRVEEHHADGDDVNYDDFIFVAGGTTVSIDIKPGSDPNCFNIDGNGVIPVAILGEAGFNVAEIDTLSLSFDGLAVRVRGKKGPLCSFEYSNADSFIDLVCHFEDDTGYWVGGGDTATVTGVLLDGTPFEGTDTICIVPSSG